MTTENKTNSETWTETRVEMLKKLWGDGLSASQIAGTMGGGITRNAVIGKVHRLKLATRAKPVSSAAQRQRPAARQPRRNNSINSGNASGMRRQIMQNSPTMGATALNPAQNYERALDIAPQPTVQELFIPVEERISLLQLNEHTCKWPIGDPTSPDFYFCGRDSNEGQPYCAFHALRAYHQPDRKKR